MRLSIIVAASSNRVIGRDNGLPWRLSSDLKRFKRLTLGHHLLMGRRTFESIGKALPGRTTVVISRGAPELPADVHLAPSIETAIDIARNAGDNEAFVAGGAEVFRETLPIADRIYLTRVLAEIDGDTYLPEFEADGWRVTKSEEHSADARNQFATRFEVLERESREPPSVSEGL